MTQSSLLPFPCDRLPDDPRVAKLLGVYPQRQEGRFMQRVKIPGGRLSPAQWRALAAIARDLTPGAPLHLTTRQDVELHDLTAEQAPVAQHRLADAGLTSVGGGGDTLRNITVCPCSGARAGTVDLLPLALEIQRTLWDYERIFELPRKFKISFSACGAGCGQPWINDLGLVASQRGGRWGFQVIAAGSLGPKPATGLLAFEWIDADEIAPLALAAIRLFDRLGDRANRSTARLRHVRQRVGDEQFVSLLRAETAAAQLERNWPSVVLPAATGELSATIRLTFPDGDLGPDAADALGELAGRPGLAVRITNEHQVAVLGGSEEDLRQAVAVLPSLRAAAQPQPCVVACPGSRWCKRALVNTRRAAERIRCQLAGRLPSGQTVRVSGCPNGCAQSGVATIGLVGKQTGPADQREEAFALLTDGDAGRGPRLAQPVQSAVKADAIAEQLAALLSNATGGPSTEPRT